jgi:hypothetical protein
MAEYYPGPPASKNGSNSDLWNTIPTSFEKKNKKYDELIMKINEILAKPSIETDDRIQLSEYNIQLRTLLKNTSAYMTEKSSRFGKFPKIETQFYKLIEKIESTLKRISEKIGPIEEKEDNLEKSRKYIRWPNNDPNNSVRSGNMAYLYKKGSPLHMIDQKRTELSKIGKDTTFYTKLFEKLLYEQQLDLKDLLALWRVGVNVNKKLKYYADARGHIIGDENICKICEMTLYDASQKMCPKKINKVEEEDWPYLKHFDKDPINVNPRMDGKVVPRTYWRGSQPAYLDSQRKYQGKPYLSNEQYAKKVKDYQEVQDKLNRQIIRDTFKGRGRHHTHRKRKMNRKTRKH